MEMYSMIKVKTMKEVIEQINNCKKADHFQQVAYSVHDSCLTQICFACEQIVTNCER